MINENITLAFENCKLEKRPALLTYIVAGDSNKNMTLNILKSISPFVDICEIGMPHNTSVADGKRIQNSSRIGVLWQEHKRHLSKPERQ